MKRVALIALFILFFGLNATSTSYAQGPDRVTDPSWQARYWNNLDLSGNAAVTRFEPSDMNYYNVTGAFADGVSADNFSARFEKYIDVPAGSYRFTVTADDGVRVSVDGALIINQWKDQANATYTADVQLTRGYHYVVVDYYDRGQLATLQFQWAPTNSQPGNGPWTAQYWNNKTLTGNPTVSTNVNEINFDWVAGAPTGIPADNFSARWVRTVNFEQGTYRFTATADDGIRLFVAGRPVIDQWRTQAATTYSYDIYILGGNTEVKVEYFEDRGNAVAKVRWERVGGTTPPPAPPTPSAGEVIVDDSSTGFVKGGSASSWRGANEGYNSNLTWTRNNDVERPNYNYARWYPSLRANSRYEVFVYIPERYTTTTAAKYWVAHREGVTSVIVNQSTNGNKWVSLGTYTFQGTNADYVSLNDITGEQRITTLIAYDAMKFVPR
jgi:hypothetical protein